ncbi:hypothetical protein ANO14919_040190 [Xylariales sp. No.14919]|nr:hypothetical protein ANO14919_040190 [Xylariales sp. No.14919]
MLSFICTHGLHPGAVTRRDDNVRPDQHIALACMRSRGTSAKASFDSPAINFVDDFCGGFENVYV